MRVVSSWARTAGANINAATKAKEVSTNSRFTNPSSRGSPSTNTHDDLTRTTRDKSRTRSKASDTRLSVAAELIHPSAWSSTLDEDEKADPPRSTLLWRVSASIYELHVGSMEGGDRPVDNGSKATAKMMAGLDLGDKYSHL